MSNMFCHKVTLNYIHGKRIRYKSIILDIQLIPWSHVQAESQEFKIQMRINDT